MTALRYPFPSMAKGETFFIADEGDPFALSASLEKAKHRYKARYGVEYSYEYDKAKGGALVTILANPHPQRAVNQSRKTVAARSAGRQKGSTANVERALWRAAFLRAFDVVPNRDGRDKFLTDCAHLADDALGQYRAFIERHKIFLAQENTSSP